MLRDRPDSTRSAGNTRDHAAAREARVAIKVRDLRIGATRISGAPVRRAPVSRSQRVCAARFPENPGEAAAGVRSGATPSGVYVCRKPALPPPPPGVPAACDDMPPLCGLVVPTPPLPPVPPRAEGAPPCAGVIE